VIPIDAVFTPIRRVNYRVEKTRVGARTDYDKLLLEIQTDGTLGPKEALGQAAQILIEQFQTFAQLSGQLPRQQPGMVPQGTVSPALNDMPIEVLDLSSRTYNCLKRSQITTVGQLLQMTEEELLGLRNFGQKSLQELHEKLAERGILPAEEGAPSRRAGEDEEEEEEEAVDVGAWPERPAGTAPAFEQEPEQEAEYEEEEDPFVRPRGHRARGFSRGRGDDDE
jgi:DNA-directed RNA polymerase subunit alpha